MSFWIATLHGPRAQITAFGSTPEKALTILVETWVEKHCSFHNDKPQVPWERVDEINIGRGELDKGYVLGASDRLWYDDFVQGDDPRLSATWDELATRFNMPSPLRSKSP